VRLTLRDWSLEAAALPENIFLVANESGEAAKLLDFGLAKFLSTATQDLTAGTAPGAVLGTLRYMSPEQWRGEEAHCSWDLWAWLWWRTKC
jgi:eukaryotic-like serine/threonine-protein kinase